MKNAGEVKKPSVTVPYTKINQSIAEVLEKHGYIKSHSKKGKKTVKTMEVELAYEDNQPKIKGVERVSKQSRRIYQKVKDIKPVRYGYGFSVLSTPKGLLTDEEARKEKVGGEVLFKIW